MEVPDQGADPLRRPILRVLDLGEELLRVGEVARVEMALGDVHLDRQTEQQLSEIVVQERGDLLPFVLPLLGHPVGQGSQHLLAVLELGVRLLERLRSEEHLPRQEERDDEGRNRVEADTVDTEDLRKDDPEDGETQVADDELRQSAHTQFTNDAEWMHPIVDAGGATHQSGIHQVVGHRG